MMPTTPVQECRDQRYVEDGVAAHMLDLLVPVGFSGPRPVVVFVHGGGWEAGSRDQFDSPEGSGFSVLRDLLLRQGWATASVDYRLSDEAQMPAQLHDVKAAVRWVRANADSFGLDATRIAVAGESAGGHLAQLLGVTRGSAEHEGDLGLGAGPDEGANSGADSSVVAVVSYYGVADIGGLVADRVATGCGRGDSGRRSPEGKVLGVDPTSPSGAEVAGQASPLTYVSGDAAPTLFIHGLQDCIVPHLQSERAHAAMEAAGVESELVLVDGGHAQPHFFALPELQERVVAFLGRHLDGSSA